MLLQRLCQKAYETFGEYFYLHANKAIQNRWKVLDRRLILTSGKVTRNTNSNL